MNVSSRPRAIIGNWKMHKTIEEAQEFVKELLKNFQPGEAIVGLAVPFTCIYPLAQQTKNSTLLIGAQTMNEAAEGAFTGEIAANMLKEAGAQFVLLGHSERRHLYHESDQSINQKLKKALESDLRPILCIGETKVEYESKETHQVIERQLKEGLKEISPDLLKNLMIAYEPVWAIGNGLSAEPETAQEVHSFCRHLLAKILTQELADGIIIQYGGSVNSSNANQLLAQPDIDGLLIGGASLSLESFQQIVNNNESQI